MSKKPRLPPLDDRAKAAVERERRRGIAMLRLFSEIHVEQVEKLAREMRSSHQRLVDGLCTEDPK